jgi:hypothetical protein
VKYLATVLIAVAALFIVAGGSAGVFEVDKSNAVLEPPDVVKELAEKTNYRPTTAKKYPIRPDQVPGLDKKYAKYRPFGWRCWYAPNMGYGIGGWPYQQVIIEERYWCGYAEGGATTYLWFTPHTDSYLCRPYNAWAVNWGGGVGYNHHMVHSQSDFSCPTNLDWYYIHHVVWQQWHCDTYTWTPCVRTNEGWYS